MRLYRKALCLGKSTLASCLLHPNWTATRELKFQPAPWPCVLGPARVQRSHLWGICVEGRLSLGAQPPTICPSANLLLSFPPLLTTQSPLCIQGNVARGRWARVTVREPRGNAADALFALINVVVSRHAWLFAAASFSPSPFAFAAPEGPVHSVYRCCELVRECMCECFHMSRQEWNPQGPHTLDSGY